MKLWLILNIIVSFIVSVTFSLAVYADEDDWGDDWGNEQEPKYELSHELSYGYSSLIDDSVNTKGEVMNELRSFSQFSFKADSYTFNADVDILFDDIVNDKYFNIDQFNFFVPFSNGVDLKIGRQVITWGTGDMVFLNDLFSKDWKSFFNGRPDSDLKPSANAIRLSQYGELLNYEIAFLPKFKPDNTPSGERYSFYLPEVGIVQPRPELSAKEPSKPEISGRLFSNKDGVEWAVYGYYGFFKAPSQINRLGELGFNKMTSFGASLRMPLASGLFNTELATYQSSDDKSGQDPFVQNSQFRFLIGYEQEIVSNLTLASQVYLERISNYQSLKDSSEAGQLVPPKNRTMLTFRLTHKALQQKLMNSLMMLISPSDDDYYVRYSSRYSFTDLLKVTAGFNWLDGERAHTFLAQMQNNSNVYFRVNYSFN